MPRFRQSIAVDDYVIDTLLRDIVGHDRQPAAFLVYLYLYGQAAREKWQPVEGSLRSIAERTGLSKSAVQTAIKLLNTRELIKSEAMGGVTSPRHLVLRHWRQ